MEGFKTYPVRATQMDKIYFWNTWWPVSELIQTKPLKWITAIGETPGGRFQN